MIVPGSVDAARARMVPAVLCITHGDHALASWQGGGPLTADALDRLVDGTGIRTRPMRQAREWGYPRLAAAKAVVIIDAAPPPVARVIDGVCASPPAFELCDGPHRLLVNSGGARAAVAPSPPALPEGRRERRRAL